MNDHDPAVVARNMAAIRGEAFARQRCDAYIAGTIRSEQPTAFWQQVRSHLKGEK